MSATPSGAREFSPWRSCLWPVHRHELKKLIPMLLIFFLITFDYNILRTLKDSLLITAKSSGAEVIPFVKVWAMFPGAVLMTVLFTWLSNYLSRERVFYVIMSIFLGYFFIFTFILYPMRDLIHPHQTADMLQETLPLGLKGFVAMMRYWTFTLFYVMSELWGNIVVFVLFWGFASQVTKIQEAKRFYGLFGVGANFSGIFAGQASVYCCNLTKSTTFGFGEDAWHQSLVFLVSLILISGLAAIALFRWLNVVVLTDKRFFDVAEVKAQGEAKKKLSLTESFHVLLKSRYLLYIAIIVVAYNVIINLTEVVWKHQVKELYPDPNDYTLYMNEIVSIIGLIATFSSLIVSGNAIRKFGWTFTALLTPLVLLVTSVVFFGLFLTKHSPAAIFGSLNHLIPLGLVVFCGSMQNILGRAAKYSVFDATKEMAFVPLDNETKLVGKAAIDGVCSRLGKSGGSVIHQGLLIFFSTLTTTAPYVAVVLVAIIVGWMIIIRLLGKEFNALASGEQSEKGPSRLVPARSGLSPLPDSGLLQEKTAV